MKLTAITIIFISLIFLVSTVSCTKVSTLNDRLDVLEKIIEKYEIKFKETAYSSQAYTDMITEYNKEIGDWSVIFEVERYEKNKDGKRMPKEEFKEVENRFLALNNRMTKMILASMPKVKPPVPKETNDNKVETK